MWRRLGDTEYCYAISEDTGGDTLRLAITDFVAVWSTEHRQPDFVELVLSCNEHLEEDGERLAQDVLDRMKLGCDANCAFTPSAGFLQLVWREDRLRLKLTLERGDPFQFYRLVTRHLLETVRDLRESEKALCDILAKKDREIEEYKLEGGQLFLKYLKTPRFDAGKHQARHGQYVSTFGDDDVPARAVRVADDKLTQSLTPKPIKKEEKSEPSSQPETSTPMGEPTSTTLNNGETSNAQVKLERSSLEVTSDEMGPVASSATTATAGSIKGPSPKKKKKTFLNM